MRSPEPEPGVDAAAPRPGRRSSDGTVGGVLIGGAIALLLGVWLITTGSRHGGPPGPDSADALRAAGADAAPTAPAMPRSVPVRIRIPAIAVNAPVVGESLDAAGHLATPPGTDRNLAGWYRGGVTPGSAGNAIMLGHVDTLRGPAVFYDLGALHDGDTVDVLRADHRTAVFSIDAIKVYEKKDFPSKTVYGPTRDPELRLITCGGGFTRGTGYLGNVVVFAHLTRAS